MALLFDQELHNQLAENGVEELTETGPAWYTFEGTGKELARGARNIGVFYDRAVAQTDDTAATALGVNQYLTRDGNVAKIRDIPPTPEADLPKYSKPDHQNSSASAIMLGSFLEQAPTILSAVVNPALGGLQGATFGASMAAQEAEERGLTGDARKWFIGITAIEDGIGGALPGVGDIGEGALLKYGSRFLVGGTLNEGLSEGGRYARAEVLERYGYDEQASQMRQWDAQVALSNFIVGGFFNLAGGRARDRVDGDGITADAIDAAQEYNRARIDPDTVYAATYAALHDNYVTESAPGLATSPRAESVHVDALGDAVDAFENGRAVDVSRHFADGPEFIARPDHGLDAGSAERQTLTGSALAQVDEVLRRADEQGLSQSTSGTTRNAAPESPPGQLSDVVDNPFDVLREQAESLRATHPELAKELLPHIDEIQAEHTRRLAEAQQYEIAAACAVINGV